jgi:2-polyprenyl-3-methyl-5-hydroxy-6-metoxy-1,4-benzoquinol methylase
MGSDYFVNHKRASKFPWSIYHRPLERHLERFLTAVSGASAFPEVLVLGGGYLHELPALPPNLRLTAVDIDDRVTQFLSGLGDERLVRCLTISRAEDLRALGPFDAIYAKEVIEHIVEVNAYLRVLVGILKPGGRMWLSTPNYGDPWLPLLESTVLELIGRLSGYSRRDLHPTRFSADRLAKLLDTEALEGVCVEKTRFKLALACTARKSGEG